MAVNQKKKKFISHSYSQQITNGRWYGDLANERFFGKMMLGLHFIISPFLLLPLFIKFLLIDVRNGIPVMNSSFGRLLKLKFTPCLCFVTDAVNYIMFLTILTCVCLIEQDSKDFTIWEYLLIVCVLSRIFIEVDNLVEQGWRKYFTRAWNIVDIAVLILLIVSAGTKKLGEDAELKKMEELKKPATLLNLAENLRQDLHFLKISYIYSVAEFVLFLRLLTLLEITKSMGPLLIALKYLLIDVVKFMGVLLMTVIGTSITIYSMNVRLESILKIANEICQAIYPDKNFNQYDKNLQAKEIFTTIKLDSYSLYEPTTDSKPYCEWLSESGVTVAPSFGNFPATLSSVMLSTFGLFDIDVSH
jgi:hypothetical protein